MKCEKAIHEFLEQEDCLYVPFGTRLHSLLCGECRKEIVNLRKEFLEAKNMRQFAMPADLGDQIMKKIAESGIVHERNVASSKWLVTGVIIFISIFLISYSDSFIWLKKIFGRELEIPLNLVLGVIITLYAASFIGSHIDDVKKVIGRISGKIHQ